MGRLFLVEVDASRLYKCKHCSVDVAASRDLMGHVTIYPIGPLGAYDTKTHEFREVVNITLGDIKAYYNRRLCYGVEIFCVQCGSLLGLEHMRYANQRPEEAAIWNFQRRYYLEKVKVEEVTRPGGAPP